MNYQAQYEKISKLLRNLLSFQNKELINIKYDDENLKNSLQEKVKKIKSQRKLGRPPGTKNILRKKNIRQSKGLDCGELKIKEYLSNFQTLEQNNDEEVIIVKKRKIYQSEKMLMQDIENFLV
ncbi:unnamed protein product [Paramecium sonneborni]|nr:unnamed protein product [Paramecium sonneborni]